MMLFRIMSIIALVVFATDPDDAFAQAPGVPGALQAGDVVRLRIWREPDLSGEFPVDQRGIVTFPKLGPMHVAEETAESLKAKLVLAYQEYLRNPSIEVIALRRINVLGAVKSPGLYPVDPTMNVADAVALAGGATPDGDRRRVEILRNGSRLTVQLSDAAGIAALALRSGDQVFVPERSWLSRNPGLLAASLSAAVSIVIAVLIR